MSENSTLPIEIVVGLDKSSLGIAFAELEAKAASAGRKIGDSMSKAMSQEKQIDKQLNTDRYFKQAQAIDSVTEAMRKQNEVFKQAKVRSPQDISAELAALRETKKVWLELGPATEGYKGQLEAIDRRTNILTEGNARARGSFHKMTAAIASLTFEITGALYGLATIATVTAGGAIFGVKFLKDIEDAKMGISGTVLSMSLLAGVSMTTSEAMNISSGVIGKLEQDSLKYNVSLADTAKLFQAIVGPGTAARMTMDEISKTAVIGAVAVKSMGLNSMQVVQEVKDLIQGGIQSSSSTLATALGLRDSDIKKAKESTQGLFAFLEERMAGFAMMSMERNNTLSGSVDMLWMKVQRLFADPAVFSSLVEGIKSISDAIGTIETDERGNFKGLKFNEDLVASVKMYSDMIRHTITALFTLAEWTIKITAFMVDFLVPVAAVYAVLKLWPALLTRIAATSLVVFALEAAAIATAFGTATAAMFVFETAFLRLKAMGLALKGGLVGLLVIGTGMLVYDAIENVFTSLEDRINAVKLKIKNMGVDALRNKQAELMDEAFLLKSKYTPTVGGVAKLALNTVMLGGDAARISQIEAEQKAIQQLIGTKVKEEKVDKEKVALAAQIQQGRKAYSEMISDFEKNDPEAKRFKAVEDAGRRYNTVMLGIAADQKALANSSLSVEERLSEETKLRDAATKAAKMYNLEEEKANKPAKAAASSGASKAEKDLSKQLMEEYKARSAALDEQLATDLVSYSEWYDKKVALIKSSKDGGLDEDKAAKAMSELRIKLAKDSTAAMKDIDAATAKYADSMSAGERVIADFTNATKDKVNIMETEMAVLKALSNPTQEQKDKLEALTKSTDAYGVATKLVTETIAPLTQALENLARIASETDEAIAQIDLEASLKGGGATAMVDAQILKLTELQRQYVRANAELENFVQTQTALGKSTSDYTGDVLEQYKKLSNGTKKYQKDAKDLENQLDKTFGKGAQKAFEEYRIAAEDTAGQAYNMFNNMFKNLEDAFTNFIMTGKLDFKSLVNSMLADLARLVAKKIILSFVGEGSFTTSLLGLAAAALGGSDSSSAGGLVSGATSLYSGATGLTSGNGILGGIGSYFGLGPAASSAVTADTFSGMAANYFPGSTGYAAAVGENLAGSTAITDLTIATNANTAAVSTSTAATESYAASQSTIAAADSVAGAIGTAAPYLFIATMVIGLIDSMTNDSEAYRTAKLTTGGGSANDPYNTQSPVFGGVGLSDTSWFGSDINQGIAALGQIITTLDSGLSTILEMTPDMIANAQDMVTAQTSGKVYGFGAEHTDPLKDSGTVNLLKDRYAAVFDSLSGEIDAGANQIGDALDATSIPWGNFIRDFDGTLVEFPQHALKVANAFNVMTDTKKLDTFGLKLEDITNSFVWGTASRPLQQGDLALNTGSLAYGLPDTPQVTYGTVSGVSQEVNMGDVTKTVTDYSLNTIVPVLAEGLLKDWAEGIGIAGGKFVDIVSTMLETINDTNALVIAAGASTNTFITGLEGLQDRQDIINTYAEVKTPSSSSIDMETGAVTEIKAVNETLNETYTRLMSTIAATNSLVDLMGGKGNEFFGSELKASLDARIAMVNTLKLEGESLDQTYARIADVISVTNTLPKALGQDISKAFGEIGVSSVQAREALIASAGGMDKFKEQTTNYLNAMFTDSERNGLQLQATSDSVNASFATMGITAPKSISAFNTLVASIDLTTPAGITLYNALMKVAPAFASVANGVAAMVSSIGNSIDSLNNNSSFATFTAQNTFNKEWGDVTAIFPDLTVEQVIGMTPQQLQDASVGLTPAQINDIAEGVAAYSKWKGLEKPNTGYTQNGGYGPGIVSNPYSRTGIPGYIGSGYDMYGAPLYQAPTPIYPEATPYGGTDASGNPIDPIGYTYHPSPYNSSDTVNADGVDNTKKLQDIIDGLDLSDLTRNMSDFTRSLFNVDTQLEKDIESAISVGAVDGDLVTTRLTENAAIEKTRLTLNVLTGLMDRFDDDSTKFSKAQGKINDVYAKYNVTAPISRNALAAFIATLDPADEAMRPVIDDINNVADAFDLVTSAIKSSIENLKTFSDSIVTDMEGIVLSGMNSGQKISYLGDKIEDFSSRIMTLQNGPDANSPTVIQEQLDLAGQLKTAILDRYNVELEAIQQTTDSTKELLQTSIDLKKWLDSVRLGSLSTLDPLGKLNEAQAQYKDTLTKAQSGDLEARKELTSKAETYLTNAQAYYASGQGYTDVFNDVTSAISDLAEPTKTTQQLLEEIKNQDAAYSTAANELRNKTLLQLSQLKEAVDWKIGDLAKTIGENFEAYLGYTGPLANILGDILVAMGGDKPVTAAQIKDYISKQGNMTAQQIYDAAMANNVNIYDVGAAYGLTPQQTDDYLRSQNVNTGVNAPIPTPVGASNITGYVAQQGYTTAQQVYDAAISNSVNVYEVGAAYGLTPQQTDEYLTTQGVSRIPGFAVGTSYVPNDMLANIHQGEMIIDPATSDYLRKYGIQVTGSGNSEEDVAYKEAMIMHLQALVKQNGVASQAMLEELQAMRAELEEIKGKVRMSETL